MYNLRGNGNRYQTLIFIALTSLLNNAYVRFLYHRCSNTRFGYRPDYESLIKKYFGAKLQSVNQKTDCYFLGFSLLFLIYCTLKKDGVHIAPKFSYFLSFKCLTVPLDFYFHSTTYVLHLFSMYK